MGYLIINEKQTTIFCLKLYNELEAISMLYKGLSLFYSKMKKKMGDQQHNT